MIAKIWIHMDLGYRQLLQMQWAKSKRLRIGPTCRAVCTNKDLAN